MLNKTMFTSLKLSKLLADNGFEGESEYCWRESRRLGNEFVSVEDFRTFGSKKIKLISEKGLYRGYYSYDILNDLCVKYAKEMFGEKMVFNVNGDFNITTVNVLNLLQQNKQDEAEEYIWKNCLFNPNNK